MSFENLLDELETMTKALPSDAGEDDAKIQAAAEDGGDGDGGEEIDGDDDDDKDEGEEMGKSFSFTLEDGTVVEAQDGTELVKSLMARVENTEGTMVKALGVAVDLIKSQGDMIKSLTDRVEKLAGQGKGRKAVVSVTEKAPATMAKSESQDAEGLTPNEFMAKALAAQAAGKITGSDVSRAESYLNKGQAIPAEIVNRVLA